MRTLILLGVLLLAPGLAIAESTTAVTPTVASSITITGLDISSSPAVDVTGGSGIWRQICVQNFNTSYFIACGESLAVSTLTTSGYVGTIIPAAPTATSPAAPTCFYTVAGNSFYCRTSSVVGTSRAGITKAR